MVRDGGYEVSIPISRFFVSLGDFDGRLALFITLIAIGLRVGLLPIISSDFFFFPRIFKFDKPYYSVIEQSFGLWVDYNF